MGHNRYTSGADKLGIASAVICAVHCLIIPLLFLVKYWVAKDVVTHLSSGSVGLPLWWESLDYLFLVVGFIAVYHASSHAPARGIKAALWLFWLCLAVAVVFEARLHWMAYIASVGLITTHFVNIQRHRKAFKNKAAQLFE